MCPGGGNVESFRISEALESGSIPVIESAQDFEVIYPNHPMPYVRDWASDDLVQVLEELLSLDSGLEELRRKLMDYWRDLKLKINSQFLHALHAPRRAEGGGRSLCMQRVEESLAHLRAAIAHEHRLQQVRHCSPSCSLTDPV